MHPWSRTAIGIIALTLPIRPVAGQERSGGEEEPVRIFRQVSPSVVELTSVTGHGTGILLNDDGLILTNAHVVVSPVPFRAKVDIERGGKIETVEFSNVRILAMHPEKDMALARIDLKEHPRAKLIPAKLVKSKAVPGQRVYAIGNPGSQGMVLNRTITAGLLSGVDRKIEGVDYYQISAAVNPGNSGGPLTDRDGNVLGIVTLKAADAENVGFAIPLSDLDLSEFGPPRRANANRQRSEELIKSAGSMLKEYGRFEKAKRTEVPGAQLLKFLIIQTYREALMNDPGNPVPYYMLGVMLTSYEEYEAAEGFLLTSLEMEPWGGAGSGYRWLGLTLAKAGRVDEAEIVWLEGVRKFPNLVGQAWDDLAIYYREREQWNDAARCAALALVCHHAKRPDLRPDFYIALLKLCRSKFPPAGQTAFDQRVQGYTREMKELITDAEKLKKAGRVTATPRFAKWLEERNRTLKKGGMNDPDAFVALTNAELQPNRRRSAMSTRTAAPSRKPVSGSGTVAGGTGKATEVISLIDTNQHAIRGRWSARNDALISPRTGEARIELPVDPPQEYDLSFTVTRSLGAGELAIGIVRDGVQSMLYFDRGSAAGIDGLDRPLLAASLLKRGRTVPLTVQVRRDGVTVTSGSPTVISKKSRTDFPKTPDDWKVRNQFRLFLGSNSTIFSIRNLTLTPAG